MADDSFQLRFDDGKDADALRTIGEVAQALGIRQHVLRYWEQHFPMLRPTKRAGGRRYYRPEDVRLVQLIDRLVNHQGYTLKGARQAIQSGAAETPQAAARSAQPNKAEELAANRAERPDLLPRLRAIRTRLAAALEG